MFRIRAMGQEISYEPEEVLKYLRLKYKCEDDENLVRLIYLEKGHRLSDGQAGGILELFFVGKHVSNMLLGAADLLSDEHEESPP